MNHVLMRREKPGLGGALGVLYEVTHLGSVGKDSASNAGDTGDVCSIPGLGRSPGEGNDNPLQDSCLGNSMDRGAWWAAVQRAAESYMTERVCAHTHTRGRVASKS